MYPNLQTGPSHSSARAFSAVPLLLTTAACASSAPNYALFGAFFPALLLCGLIGVLATVMARLGFVFTNLTSFLPGQLLVCVAVGVIVASLVWLGWLGQ